MGDFAQEAALLLRDRISVLAEAADELPSILAYDLDALLQGGEDGRFQSFLEDGSLHETAACLVKAFDDGHFDALAKDPVQVVKSLAQRISKERGGVKKKKLMVPIRLCLTSTDRGPDMSKLLDLLRYVDDNVLCEASPLAARVGSLRTALSHELSPS